MGILFPKTMPELYRICGSIPMAGITYYRQARDRTAWGLLRVFSISLCVCISLRLTGKKNTEIIESFRGGGSSGL